MDSLTTMKNIVITILTILSVENYSSNCALRPDAQTNSIIPGFAVNRPATRTVVDVYRILCGNVYIAVINIMHYTQRAFPTVHIYGGKQCNVYTKAFNTYIIL